jgi:hypothetical protein
MDATAVPRAPTISGAFLPEYWDCGMAQTLNHLGKDAAMRVRSFM